MRGDRREEDGYFEEETDEGAEEGKVSRERKKSLRKAQLIDSSL